MTHYIFANGVDLKFDEVNDGVFICVVGNEKMFALINHKLYEEEQKIHSLLLSVRATNVLKAGNIETIKQLIECLNDCDYCLSKIRNCGKVTEREIKNALKERGLSWGMKK